MKLLPAIPLCLLMTSVHANEINGDTVLQFAAASAITCVKVLQDSVILDDNHRGAVCVCSAIALVKQMSPADWKAMESTGDAALVNFAHRQSSTIKDCIIAMAASGK